MTAEARALWERAIRALLSADTLLQHGDPDRAASTAYYASFYAVNALFALGGASYSKHSAVEAAVHRDLPADFPELPAP